jgi:hypothetical protein
VSEVGFEPTPTIQIKHDQIQNSQLITVVEILTRDNNIINIIHPLKSKEN